MFIISYNFLSLIEQPHLFNNSQIINSLFHSSIMISMVCLVLVEISFDYDVYHQVNDAFTYITVFNI